MTSRKNIQISRVFTNTRAKETASESGSCCPAISIQRLQDLERSLYKANKLVDKQQEEIVTLMNHVKLQEEEKIKMVSVTDDDLRSSTSIYA